MFSVNFSQTHVSGLVQQTTRLIICTTPNSFGGSIDGIDPVQEGSLCKNFHESKWVKTAIFEHTPNSLRYLDNLGYL